MTKLISLKLLTYSLFIAGTVNVACTREASPRRSHAAPTEESTTIPSEPELARKVSISEAKENAPLFVTKFRERLDRAKLESELRSQNTNQRTELYSYTQRAAGFVDTLDKDDHSRKELLKTFKSVMSDGCNNELVGCRFASLFRGNPETVGLLIAAADELKNQIVERYLLLRLALSSVGQRADMRIAIAYLETADLYEEILKNQKSRIGLEALEQHREIVDQLILRLKETTTLTSSGSHELFKSLESSLDLWNFDRPRNNHNAAREEVVLGFVANRLYSGSDTSAISPELNRQLDILAHHKQSAISKLLNVKEAARLSLGVEESLPKNLNTFLFESLWLGRMTANESDIIWKQNIAHRLGGTAPLEIREAAMRDLLNYGRTRLLISARDANQILTDFFNSKDRFATADAFHEAIKESLKGKTLWADSIRRFETLRDFFHRNLRSMDQSKDSTNKNELFFASIDRNIKLLSTYPSMLVMSYHLARLGFSLKIETWGGFFEIHAGQILDWFFDGKLDPWMEYSTDQRKLSKTEISMVYHYALEMGTLKDGGVNLEDFFKILVDQMVGPSRSDVARIDDAFQSSYENDPGANEFYRLCDQLESVKSDQSIAPAPPIKLSALTYFTIMGLPSAFTSEFNVHSVFAAGWSFLEQERKVTSMRLDENLEIIRLEFTPKIVQMRMLARITEDYLNRNEIADRSQTVNFINQKIKALESLQQRVYTRIFKLLKKTANCGEKFTQSEITAEFEVIKAVEIHFRKAYAVMANLRSASRRGGTSTTLDRRYNFSGKVVLPGLTEHEAALGISPDAYRTSRLQMLLRIADILENGYVDETIKINPRREKGSISLPARLRDVNEHLRTTLFRIEWTDNVEDFVSNGLQNVFDPKFGFINWTSLNLLAVSTKMRIRSMAALAKAGTVQTDEGPQRMEPKEIVRLALRMQKWLEVDNSVWTKILNVTGQFTRLDLTSMLDDFAWEKSTHNWIGSLDYVFDQLTRDKLGAGDASNGGEPERPSYTRRNGPLETFKQHSKIMRAFGEPTLKIPESTLREITNVHAQALDVQVNLAADLIHEARRLEPLRSANPAIFPSWRLYSSRKYPDVPLLSNSAVEVFRSSLFEYSRQTGYKVPDSVQSALDKR